jgi:hypothetical protein
MMLERPWTTQEVCGEWRFRARAQRSGDGFIAEARQGPFETDSCLTEPAHINRYFEFGDTAVDAIEKLKREVLS